MEATPLNKYEMHEEEDVGRSRLKASPKLDFCLPVVVQRFPIHRVKDVLV